jgi:hypothetical protein
MKEGTTQYEWELRGEMARLKCWHRLTEDEANDLLRFAAARPATAAQQEPVAEVKLKTTGGNVGIATVIHEIYSHYREPLRPGDKLYTTPPPCPTCEALARSVMMDQTGRDA